LALAILGLTFGGVARPGWLLNIARHFASRGGLWFAAAIRAVLAVLLWLTAPVAQTPTVFRVFAVLALLAAIGLPILGPARAGKLMDRFAAMPGTAVRAMCLAGVAFGGFLLWAIYPAL
jgi:hypothetical protein